PRGPIQAAPGDSLLVSFRADDADEVTAVEMWLTNASGVGLRLARLPGGATSAIVTIPNPPPFTGKGSLVGRPLDEHGRRRDRTSVAIALETAAGEGPSAAGPLTPVPTPNPFRRSLRLTGPPGASIVLVDLLGRIVRRARLDARFGAFTWDGRDQS